VSVGFPDIESVPSELGIEEFVDLDRVEGVDVRWVDFEE
jgi:hypothetical protein